MMKIKMKIKRITAFILLAVLTVNSGMAQKLFTLEELNFGGRNARQFVPQYFYYMWWGDRLVDTNNPEYNILNPATGKPAKYDPVSESGVYSAYGWDEDNGNHKVRRVGMP